MAANIVASISMGSAIVGVIVLNGMRGHESNATSNAGAGALNSEDSAIQNLSFAVNNSNSINGTSQPDNTVAIHSGHYDMPVGERAMTVAVGILGLVGTTAMCRPGRFSVLTKTCSMASMPMLTVAKTYGASLVVQVILAVIAPLVAPLIHSDDDFTFHQSIFFVLTTFVGGGYGDVYPATTAGRCIITLVSTCGFVLQLFHIVLVVQTALNHAAQGDAGHKPSAFSKFKLLLPVYLAAACTALVLGLFMHAVGGVGAMAPLNLPESADTNLNGTDNGADNVDPDLMDSLYMLWMATHGTTFGEIIPGNFAGRLITWLAMLMHYVLVVGFAALTAIPNQRVFNFINIPLLSEQESTAGPTHVQVEAPSSPGTI
jgi:hypothetical protein